MTTRGMLWTCDAINEYPVLIIVRVSVISVDTLHVLLINVLVYEQFIKSST